MPSPFPGVDPYLEHSRFWQGFHNAFMTYALEALLPGLPAHYAASIEVRIYFERETSVDDRLRIPDLENVRTGPAASGPLREEAAAPQGQVLELDALEVREAYLDIYRIADERVVTSIELLSPANKRPGTGRGIYIEKQWEMFSSGVNLVEVDLLRKGQHAVLVSAERLASLPPFHYLAGIFRAWQPLQYEVLTWTVRDLLPKVQIPLAPDEPHLLLDLQAVFTRTYDGGGFERKLRYDAEPPVPLAPADAEWADALLREAGLRGDTCA
jgi:hypothetical protein